MKPDKKRKYRRITPAEHTKWEVYLNAHIIDGYREAVDKTMSWLESPAAEEFFKRQSQQLTTFFTTSGIRDTWENIIETRANTGKDITKQIYDYARSVNMTDHLVPYTRAETLALNRLCDYNYELIRNVTNDEITAIRRTLVQDFAEGVYPLRTNLKKLELEPINGFSPSKRAEMIARTETARTLNVSTLTTLMNDGVKEVILYGCDPTCDECYEYCTEPQKITDALDLELPHPNCTGVWSAYYGDELDQTSIQEHIDAHEEAKKEKD